MSNSLLVDSFLALSKISYHSKSLNSKTEIDPVLVATVVANTNIYLEGLAEFFESVDFDFFSALGQRNISGFIGEIFVKSFEKTINGYKFNPHGDGRPDVLDLLSDESKQHYKNDVFGKIEGSVTPLKSKLAPYKYGGLEVKATIGNPVTNYRKRLVDEKNVSAFMVGMPRYEYLSSITYWGHHTSCENLIGLYYDYVAGMKGVPQVIAVMHSELIPESDWNKVSLGKEGSKKTSNTSLTTPGRKKLYENVICVLNDKEYISALSRAGLKIH